MTESSAAGTSLDLPSGQSLGLPSGLLGLVDIHFHGAFGIDLMTACQEELTWLSQQLWKAGIAAFCPTTVSAPPELLLKSVQTLGSWICDQHQTKTTQAAIPLGIHLEGPFLSKQACGAHRPHSIRDLSMEELERLWIASKHTLKIITLAPETLSKSQLKKLVAWSRLRKITLSLGHSQATTPEATLAFDYGFQGVTHAWNAMPFHHRTPGVLGSALGRPDVYLELMIDLKHVSLEVIDWTRKLHAPAPLCFISDCLSAGGRSDPFKSKSSLAQETLGGTTPIHFKAGACRLNNGQLAGGGLLLSQAYAQWIIAEFLRTQRAGEKRGTSRLKQILKQTLKHVTSDPLEALQLSESVLRELRKRKVRWKITFPSNISLANISLANISLANISF